MPSDQLFYIRSQQVYGLLAVIYLYIALIISPVGFIIGKQRVVHFEFARRAIGVSVFYFALLHGVIALWGQLGGVDRLNYLPVLFQWSLLAGFISFVILLTMAATSLDKAIRFMTHRKWKWLHRLVYLATVLIVLHVWSIGTHLAYDSMRLIGFTALCILAGLELYKTTKLLNKNRLKLDKFEETTLFLALWLVITVAIFFMPTFVQNYHSRHSEHQSSVQEHN